MSIEWGPEIQVQGERPKWLRDDLQRVALSNTPDWRSGFIPINPKTVGEALWFAAKAFHLPADHWAYRAIEKGFTPWAGGDAAPEDWDGGYVLFRDGSDSDAHGFTGGRLAWHHTDDWDDIIGYRKKAVASEALKEVVAIYRENEAANWKPDQATVYHVAEKLRAAGHAEAAELIAPTPVDPDLVEARNIAARMMRESSVTWKKGLPDKVQSGEMDDDLTVQIPLAALKRGRELAA